ncbi:pilin, partial [Pseudomonas aeruginosa]|nr:pilin [Pseudomonas aeruginosa]MBK1590248.1 pilin [Pseudomonas aeruginosa]
YCSWCLRFQATVSLMSRLHKNSYTLAVITVSRTADGVWGCSISSTPANWKPNYAPSNCPKS